MGAAALCATAILGQALPRMFPAQPAKSGYLALQNERRIFHIGANEYLVTLEHDDVFDGPEWNPSRPLPLDFGKVEKIAREELRKLIPDDSHWEVTNLGLNRLWQTLRPEWYYVIDLQPKWDGISPSRDRFSEMIALSGKPGKVELQTISQR
jgi:hypothetical protein